jgi:hypothetical protein
MTSSAVGEGLVYRRQTRDPDPPSWHFTQTPTGGTTERPPDCGYRLRAQHNASSAEAVIASGHQTHSENDTGPKGDLRASGNAGEE